MEKVNIFADVFKKNIRKERFETYCAHFELDLEEAAADLKMRGYHIMSH